ncbi:flavin-dependent oxidoreductase [Nocardia brevicatena]|uniref:flavin-dependent oxidoreductase n=1 Tax=Nocardia brevicatena TaxID=37327 RepID=UPI0002DE42BD|nr:flavin-dependent oxidoreductase [Nocardia brevicatena]
MKILIAGGGIGGLSAALGLHAAGFTDIRIVEAARKLRPLGVGLNILPNAVRELTELGLYDQLTAGAIATHELALYSRHGQLIWKEPRGLAAGYHWPQLSIHRGYLQGILAQAVRERLGAAAITTQSRVVGYTRPCGRTVSVTVERAGIGTTVINDIDLLIGADGIRSAVRASLYPDEGPPPGNGLVMWRGTTWAAPFLDGKSMLVTGDDVQRIVLYPIAEDPTRGVLINWVAARPAETDPSGHGDWSREVPVAEVLDHFGHWRFDWLDFPAILGSASRVYRYPMVDRDALPQWTFGRVTLLGDAAHAMYPMGSNGATQSIIDAVVLARALAATGGDIPEALAVYEAERRPSMTLLQASNRQQGPEAVIAMVHQRAPHGFDRLHDVISERELAEVSARYASTAGFDVETVNTPPPRGSAYRNNSNRSGR